MNIISIPFLTRKNNDEPLDGIDNEQIYLACKALNVTQPDEYKPGDIVINTQTGNLMTFENYTLDPYAINSPAIVGYMTDTDIVTGARYSDHWLVDDMRLYHRPVAIAKAV